MLEIQLGSRLSTLHEHRRQDGREKDATRELLRAQHTMFHESITVLRVPASRNAAAGHVNSSRV